jgi:ribosomal protein L7/L12
MTSAAEIELRHRIADLERRLAAVERRLDGVPEPPGAQEPAPDQFAEVRALLAEGKMIQAIKLYHEQTGCDLATAKAEVERLLP